MQVKALIAICFCLVSFNAYGDTPATVADLNQRFHMLNEKSHYEADFKRLILSFQARFKLHEDLVNQFFSGIEKFDYRQKKAEKVIELGAKDLTQSDINYLSTLGDPASFDRIWEADKGRYEKDFIVDSACFDYSVITDEQVAPLNKLVEFEMTRGITYQDSINYFLDKLIKPNLKPNKKAEFKKVKEALNSAMAGNNEDFFNYTLRQKEYLYRSLPPIDIQELNKLNIDPTYLKFLAIFEKADLLVFKALVDELAATMVD